MDFFSAQDSARKRTTLLIFYFSVAVAFIILGVYGAVLVVWNHYDTASTGLWHPDLFSLTALAVLAVVMTGTVTKSIALSRQGGEAVATMLGGVPVNPNTADPDQKKLLNVVEEMAIASGLPVPSVFVLPDENGINAFAAGINTGDAVVAVTEGCLRRLTRDELQGVIGHEFSHILNGDMRLNVRIMGVIFGILMIASIGRGILRGGSRTRSARGGRKGSAGPVLAMAAIILAIGYIGVFFGRLIQAAVSRQREFLADASAVQFTRNPSGLAGALKKIAGHSDGSRVLNSNAEEAGHFFFSAATKSLFNRFFATHPPVEERIGRLNPASSENAGHGATDVPPGISNGDRLQFSPAGLAAGVGSPGPGNISCAEKVMADLPGRLKEASHEPFGARALVYCLLMGKGEKERKTQFDWLRAHADAAVLREVDLLMPLIGGVERAHRLPLAEMAMPALKALSPGQYRVFRGIVQSLAAADKRVSLFEYALHRMLVRNLDGFFAGKKTTHRVYRSFGPVENETLLLLSALAWTGNQSPEEAGEAFLHGLAHLGIQKEFTIVEKDRCSFQALDRALGTLADAAPALKKKLLMACVACVSHDQWLSLDEFELLRAVADSMDLPIPPVSPGSMAQSLQSNVTAS